MTPIQPDRPAAPAAAAGALCDSNRPTRPCSVLAVCVPLTGARAPQDRARRVLFLRQRLAHGGASPDEDAHDDIFGFFVRLFAVERLCFRCVVLWCCVSASECLSGVVSVVCVFCDLRSVLHKVYSTTTSLHTPHDSHVDGCAVCRAPLPTARCASQHIIVSTVSAPVLEHRCLMPRRWLP